eukprot:10020857-Heterocapsa_arctica.AAC.1
MSTSSTSVAHAVEGGRRLRLALVALAFAFALALSGRKSGRLRNSRPLSRCSLWAVLVEVPSPTMTAQGHPRCRCPPSSRRRRRAAAGAQSWRWPR